MTIEIVAMGAASMIRLRGCCAVDDGATLNQALAGMAAEASAAIVIDLSEIEPPSGFGLHALRRFFDRPDSPRGPRLVIEPVDNEACQQARDMLAPAGCELFGDLRTAEAVLRARLGDWAMDAESERLTENWIHGEIDQLEERIDRFEDGLRG